MGLGTLYISATHVAEIDREVSVVELMVREEEDKTSERYFVLVNRLNDLLEALDRAANLMITRSTYEHVESERRHAEGEWLKNDPKYGGKKVIGFTNSRD